LISNLSSPIFHTTTTKANPILYQTPSGDHKQGYTTNKTLFEKCRALYAVQGWSFGDEEGMDGELNDATKEQMEKYGGIVDTGAGKISKGCK
jgi:hypothetical protein